MNQDLKKQGQSCTFAQQNGTLIMVVEDGRTTLDLLKKPDMVIDSKYRVESLIGEGGMGAVYRAHHLLLQKYVALKTFRTNNLTEEAWQRFRREAQSIARLKHKNIVEVFDFGIAENNLPYYTMSLLDGESLEARLEREKRLSVGDALAIFLPVAEALLHAHANNIVHRDIKPANIFLDKSYMPRAQKAQVKIVDFGIAKLAEAGTGNAADDDQQSLTVKGTVFGSPLYMSPEQINGQSVDQRSDIYSFGCALFETLAGEPPFRQENALATMLCHLQKEAPSLRDLLGEKQVSQRLDRVVNRLLAKELSRRYQSFNEVIEELKVCLEAVKDEQSIVGGNNEKPAALPLEGNTVNERQATASASQSSKSGFKIGSILVGILVCIGFFIFVANMLLGKGQMPVSTNKNETKNFASRAAESGAVEKASSSSSSIEHSDPFVEQRAAAVADRRKFLIRKEGNLCYFDFPKYAKIGCLSLYGTGNKSLYGTGKKKDCIGTFTFTVPPGYALEFEAGEDFSISPALFRRFGPNDLQVLEMGNASAAWKVSVFEYLMHLQGLNGITVHGDNIDDSVIPYLEKFSCLRILDLSNTKVDCAKLAESKILMQELSSVNVNGLIHVSALVDRLLVYSDKSHLTEFMAKYCSLSDDDLKKLAKIKSLETLGAVGGNFSLQGIQYLADNSNLKTLQLEQNHLGFNDLCKIHKFKHLNVLFVDLGNLTVEQQHKIEANLKPAQVNFQKAELKSEHILY